MLKAVDAAHEAIREESEVMYKPFYAYTATDGPLPVPSDHGASSISVMRHAFSAVAYYFNPQPRKRHVAALRENSVYEAEVADVACETRCSHDAALDAQLPPSLANREAQATQPEQSGADDKSDTTTLQPDETQFVTEEDLGPPVTSAFLSLYSAPESSNLFGDEEASCVSSNLVYVDDARHNREPGQRRNGLSPTELMLLGGMEADAELKQEMMRLDGNKDVLRESSQPSRPSQMRMRSREHVQSVPSTEQCSASFADLSKSLAQVFEQVSGYTCDNCERMKPAAPLVVFETDSNEEAPAISKAAMDQEKTLHDVAKQLARNAPVQEVDSSSAAETSSRPPEFDDRSSLVASSIPRSSASAAARHTSVLSCPSHLNSTAAASLGAFMVERERKASQRTPRKQPQQRHASNAENNRRTKRSTTESDASEGFSTDEAASKASAGSSSVEQHRSERPTIEHRRKRKPHGSSSTVVTGLTTNSTASALLGPVLRANAGR